MQLVPANFPPMEKFAKTMRCRQPLIGMVHVHSLPGTAGYGGSVQAIVDAALQDAATLKRAGIDAILLENMHDLPYLRREVGHEISTVMALVAYLCKKAFGLPTGMQILAGANQAALGASLAAGLDFIRAEGFVFGHLADEGWMDADAGPLLRYRKLIGAEDILILTDIKKKHSAHAATSDISLAETAHAAEFFKSDGLIITGSATGKTASTDDLQSLQGQTSLPVLVGSGIDAQNIRTYMGLCNGFIVGSSIKIDGDWRKAVDLEKATRLVSALKS
jgi:membrane complex biogenesis BtpA family protein